MLLLLEEAQRLLFDAGARLADEFGIGINADAATVQLVGNTARRAAAAVGVEHDAATRAGSDYR